MFWILGFCAGVSFAVYLAVRANEGGGPRQGDCWW